MTYKIIQREPTSKMIWAGAKAVNPAHVNVPPENIVPLVIRAAWDAAPQVDGYKLQDLTDDEIVKVLASLGIDTYPSKYGFPARQVEATSVPAIREIVAAYLAAAQSQPAAQSTAAQEAKDAAQPDWKAFAAKVLQASRENLSGVDGGDIQDWAVECGLLAAQMQAETCGEECRCAEYGMDLPWECFRYSPDAAQAVAALSQSAKEIKG